MLQKSSRFWKREVGTLPTEPTRIFLMFLCRRLLECLGSLNKANLWGSCESVLRFLQKECQAVKSNYYLQLNKVTALFLGMKEFEKSNIVWQGAQLIWFCIVLYCMFKLQRYKPAPLDELRCFILPQHLFFKMSKFRNVSITNSANARKA